MKTQKTVPLTFLDVIIIIFFLLSVYFILTRIFGHSATDLSIAAAVFTLLGGLVIKTVNGLSRLNREFGEFKVKTIMSFEKVHTDLNKITVDLDKIKNKLKVT